MQARVFASSYANPHTQDADTMCSPNIVKLGDIWSVVHGSLHFRGLHVRVNKHEQPRLACFEPFLQGIHSHVAIYNPICQLHTDLHVSVTSSMERQ